METWSCVLVGEGPLLIAVCEQVLSLGGRLLGVVSGCSQVERWCQEKGVVRVDHQPGWMTHFQPMRPDFLFSVVNHKILSREELELPLRSAVNYHDSLLPELAGFNATSWAIIERRAEHGITWHRMSDRVDGGGVLIQERIAIAQDETAFTLAMRCGEAAVRSFPRLIDGLLNDSLTVVPEQAPTSFHFRYERPGLAILNLHIDPQQVSALVRALDLGSDDNWMSTPKILTDSGQVWVAKRCRVIPDVPSVATGHIIDVSPEGVRVAAEGGGVLLQDLCSPAGEAATEAALRASGVVAGRQLASLPAETAQALESFDAEVSRHERFWAKRLTRFKATQLSEIKRAEGGRAASTLSRDVGANFSNLSPDERAKRLLAGLVIYLKRLGDGDGAVCLGAATSGLPGGAQFFFSGRVPLLIELSSGDSHAFVLDAAGQEITRRETYKTFALDLALRYSALRDTSFFEEPLPVVVHWGDAPHDLSGLALNLASSQIELSYHPDAVNEVQAELIARRLARIVELGIANEQEQVGEIGLIPEEERYLLVETWQRTEKDFESKCVHEFFEQRARENPEATALVCRGEELTYAELDSRAHALAVELSSFGVGPDDLVGVCLERSIGMVVAILGVLKAGAAYVPLDPAYPTERVSYMVEDSRAKVVITEQRLRRTLPKEQTCLLIDNCPTSSSAQLERRAAPHNLAYVIFTSGSTGRPKGVMVEHRNVANFFSGMDDVLGTEPGVWLAVTSISFDISVLELLWTLARGFTVVLQEEGDRASLQAGRRLSAAERMGFGLFYFAADSSRASEGGAYRLLLEGAQFADAHGFDAVWTPERHFHEFGGLYPNAALTSAALAVVTQHVQIRAGSVVLPLHNPIRVAEDWAVVDNLSGGRVGLSFASGWHANDFVLKPDNFERRREVMYESIDKVLALWRGEKVSAKNGEGSEIQVSTLPGPVRAKPPIWIASAGNVSTFQAAGRKGYNVLTNMLGQDINDLGVKFQAYRRAWAEAGHSGQGTISVMLHTFVCGSDEEAKRVAKEPFCQYLATSYDLVKVAPWMFPAFKQPSQGASSSSAFDPETFDDEDKQALLEHAFERYFETAGLFGTPERALRVVEKLREIGANEVACLIDFGIDPQVVLDNLSHLNRLRELANQDVGEHLAEGSDVAVAPPLVEDVPPTISEQLDKRAVTHFQCTPSMARMLLADGTSASFGGLKQLLLGGEALSDDLVQRLSSQVTGQMVNMYGPTETTIWSTISVVEAGKKVSIGRPIANTTIRILGPRGDLLPVGVAGELCIGGAGVVRGYWQRQDLTQERFVPDPCSREERLYRTGDLARYLPSGELEYLGRIDQQVKLNGYRIELGEVEAAMTSFPLVREAVAAVKPVGADSQLVGYYVQNGSASDSQMAGVEKWGELWNQAYERRIGSQGQDRRFDVSGWLSSFTGAPLEQQELREWVDATVARVLAGNPRRVLELGCGTGLILFGCLAHVDHYTGIDLSSHALAEIRAELTPEEQQKVALLRRAADELTELPFEHYDSIVINSVIQYFPSEDYLSAVLSSAVERLSAGGELFLGDIRSLQHLGMFHSMVEVFQADEQLSAAELSSRIELRCQNEAELLLSPQFFLSWLKENPQMELVRLQLKDARADNEMSLFRYDVTLRKVDGKFSATVADVPTLNGPSLESVREALGRSPEELMVTNMPNARLSRLATVSKQLNEKVSYDARALRATLEQSPNGIHPRELSDLDDAYEVECRFGAKDGEFSALFRRRSAVARVWGIEVETGPRANAPTKKTAGESILAPLRKHLAEFLPLYMIPGAFVELDKFPLTPNGKVDRKALPSPDAQRGRVTDVAFRPAANDLEREIASIWRGLLGVERVGTRDNIFDLGASSLLTVEANNLLQSKLGRKIPLVNMFRYPTIESLGRFLDQEKAQPGEERGATGAEKPLSKKEERLRAAAEQRRKARERLQSS